MKNRSLRFKLFTLSAFLLMFSVIVGGVGYWAEHTIVANFSKVSDWNLPNTRYVYDMIMFSRQARIYAFQLPLPGLDPVRGQELAVQVESIFKKFDESREIYLKEQFGPGEEEIWKKLDAALLEVRSYTLKVVELYKKNPRADSAEMTEMVTLITKNIDQANEKVKPLAAELIKYHVDSAAKNTIAAKNAAEQGTLYTILAIAIGTISGALFAISFSNTLVNMLSSISKSLADAGSNVSSGSSQIASASQELSQSTTEQAASLQETASSIEEMNSMITRNTDNARKSSDLSLVSQSNAQKGKATVDQMIQSIDEINASNAKIKDQIDQSNAQMQEIVKVIGEIGNRTKVINDIVFQTKLLSFNASVEAARAGEHGKGFAVVAEEVGNLASMSGNAAQEISKMLEESIKKVEDIVTENKLNIGRLVEESKVKVEAGTKIANDCGRVLEDIVSSISNVASMTQEISVASTEQAQGMSEITKAMYSLDQVTQQNSSVSEQAASAAEELSGQAMALNDLVRSLVQTINGGDEAFKQQMAVARTQSSKDNVVNIPIRKAAPAPVQEKSAAKLKPTADQTPVYEDSRFSDV